MKCGYRKLYYLSKVLIYIFRLSRKSVIFLEDSVLLDIISKNKVVRLKHSSEAPHILIAVYRVDFARTITIVCYR